MSIRITAAAVTMLALSGLQCAAQQDCAGCNPCSPNDPWKELAEGVKRVTDPNGRGPRPRTVAMEACRRKALEGKKQQPYAIVLSCSDSRVPPELAFDQRMGDLFIVRVAGNIPTDEAIGSIEYAIDDLKTPKLIVVLGHSDCGAIKATLARAPAGGLIPSILNRIFPSVEGMSPVDLEKATKKNVQTTVRLLPTYSKIIADARSRGTAIKGAYYSVASGQVELVD